MLDDLKTKEVTELVEVTRWTCSVAGHSHKTHDVAERCIEKNRNRNHGAAKRRWTESMIADVCADVVGGMTYTSVGEKYGLQSERIRQVCRKGIRMMLHPARLDEPFPYHDTYSVDSVRKNSDFWNRRIAKLRNSP